MWPTILTVVPVATLVSIAVSLIVRWLDRPRPRLTLETQLTDRKFSPPGDAGYKIGTVALTNVGDGTAYELEVYGDRCDAAVELGRLALEHSGRYSNRLPHLLAGETLLIRAAVDDGHQQDARLVVRWDPSPGRPFAALRRRILDVRLYDIDSASPFPPGMMSGDPLPRRFRRLRDLARHTERGRLRTTRGQAEADARDHLDSNDDQLRSPE